MSMATDLRLWIVAPIVGGAAGYGMMRGTQMRGGIAAGLAAAALTIAAIFGARYAVVRYDVAQAMELSPDAALEALAAEVASEWEQAGYETYDEESDDYAMEVYEEADARWVAMSGEEQSALKAELESGNDAVQGVLTPLALIFDFGLFGVLCTALAAGAAFKTGSVTLEEALLERGHAGRADDARRLAGTLRCEAAGLEPGLTTIDTGPMTLKDTGASAAPVPMGRPILPRQDAA